MKKLVITTLLVLSGYASSQATPAVNCEKVEVGSFINFRYETTATFPNPPKSEYFSLSNDKFNFSACGLSVNGDANKVVIKANDFSTLMKYTKSISTKDPYTYVGLIVASGYKYPSIKEGFYAYSLPININYLSREVGTISEYLGFFNDGAIGYRLDNGPLVPYYYQGKITPFTYPSGTKILNFYVMPSILATRTIERFEVNLADNQITMWYKHDFPSQ